MDFLIVSASDPNWQSRLADCSIEHARSVFAQLEDDPTVPGELELHRLYRNGRRKTVATSHGQRSGGRSTTGAG